MLFRISIFRVKFCSAPTRAINHRYCYYFFFSPSSSFPYFSLSFFFSNRELLKYESRKKSRSSDVEKEGKICIPCVSGGKTFFTGQVGSVVDSLKRWKTVAWLFTGLDGTATNYEPTRKRITAVLDDKIWNDRVQAARIIRIKGATCTFHGTVS